MDDIKKIRKKVQLQKNRKQQEMLHAFKLMRQEGERVRQQQEEGPALSAPSAEPETFGGKVMAIRNRLTDKKRVSRERWNRFAGTGGEGGRGL